MGSARSFFDFDPAKARGPRTGPDVGRDATEEILSGPAQAQALTVAQLVGQIKSTLAEAFASRVHVVGQISNFKRHGSGHLYFRLKDADAAIDAVMWRSAAGKLRFKPEDGLEVVASGRVDVYDVRGQLQIYVETMSPKGTGALELAFRQLRQKLQAEGLFAPEAKKPVPRFPRAIGVITSPTGAAIRDIRRTLLRRWPGAKVYLLGVRVQGDAAAGEIAEAIGLLDAAGQRLQIDTILLARGGGSLEDLWAFNEEVVARAIHAARTPIICGVGHEVDTTIADLVADVRAATPTAAAEVAVPALEEVRRTVEQLGGRLTRCAEAKLETSRAVLAAITRSGMFRDPMSRLRMRAQQLDALTDRLDAAARQGVHERVRKVEPLSRRLAGCHPALLSERARGRLDRTVSQLAWQLGALAKRASDRLERLAGRFQRVHPAGKLALARQTVEAAARQLESMSYRAVLQRGFSVTRRADGQILRSVGQVQPGQAVETELADGRFSSTTEGGAGTGSARPSRRRKPKTDSTDAAGQDTLFQLPQDETP
jgi:exodeoxyribonuclease VII large subunit